MTVEPRTAPQEISLVEAVWRYRWMSLVIVIMCVLVSIAATQMLFGTAEASARFAISDPTNKNSLSLGVVSGTGFSTYTEQRAVFAQSAPVLERAAKILADQGGPKRSLAQMRSRVSTEAAPDGGVVHVTATGESMQIAAATANAVIKSYQELSSQAVREKRERQLENIRNAQRSVANQLAKVSSQSRQAVTLASNLRSLQQKESELLLEAANDDDGVQFIDYADPSAEVPSKLPRNGAIGLAVGILLATVASFLRASAPTAAEGGTRPSARGREGSRSRRRTDSTSKPLQSPPGPVLGSDPSDSDESGTVVQAASRTRPKQSIGKANGVPSASWLERPPEPDDEPAFSSDLSDTLHDGHGISIVKAVREATGMSDREPGGRSSGDDGHEPRPDPPRTPSGLMAPYEPDR